MQNIPDNKPLIGYDEAPRLLRAIRRYMKYSPVTKRPYWYNLLKQLAFMSYKDALVPDHMKQAEWESLRSSPPTSSS